MSIPAIETYDARDVRGVLHRPDASSNDDGVVLAHGAGGNRDAPVLVALAAAFCAAGFTVLRIDLPFRQRRPKGPPSPHTAAADRDGLRAAASALRGVVRGRLCLGGHSYGGRQATMLAADDPDVADALLLLSYPLHPPKKPDQLRTAHFPRLQTPCVFVHGTTDGFATIAELAAALATMPARHELIAIAGAGHDLKRGKFDHRPVVEAVAALLR